jgi:hypothetical protein
VGNTALQGYGLTRQQRARLALGNSTGIDSATQLTIAQRIAAAGGRMPLGLVGRFGDPKKEAKGPQYLRNRFLDEAGGAAAGRNSLRINPGDLVDDSSPAAPAPAAPAAPTIDGQPLDEGTLTVGGRRRTRGGITP